MAPQRDIRLQFTKWDGSEHWGADLRLLGEDEHGVWLGGADGTRYERPGQAFDACPHVVLLPRDDWFVATWYARPQGAHEQFDLYVDIATPPTLAVEEAFAVDLDLDVVRRVSGRIDLDDEDELEEHAARFGYPSRVVVAAREAAERVVGLVRAGAAPFDGAHGRWLAQVR